MGSFSHRLSRLRTMYVIPFPSRVRSLDNLWFSYCLILKQDGGSIECISAYMAIISLGT